MNSTTQFYLIQNNNDLLFLKSLKSIFYRHQSIKFNIENLNSDVKKKWESRINKYYKACGCNEGKFFVLFCLIGSILWLSFKSQLYFSSKNSGFVFLTCLIGAFIGKAYGQYNAFIKLRAIINKLEKSNWDFSVVD